MQTDPMEEEIRALILKYGLRPVREGIEKEYRAMYDYLKTLYGDMPQQQQQQQQPNPVPEAVSPTPTPEKKTIRKAKKAAETEQQQQTLENTIELIQEQDQVVEEAIEEETEEEEQHHHDPTDKEVTVVTKVKGSAATASSQPYKEKTPEEIREAKQQHRDAVQKKRDELVAKGVQPESLLTKENLEKWLKAGKSYQQIAREFTGVHETQVSAIAKAFGLQSSVSKLSGGFVRRTLAPS